MKRSSSASAPSPDLARQRVLDVLALLQQGVSRAAICRSLQVNSKTIKRVIKIENLGGTATIRPRRSNRKELEWRRLRIELVHELARRRPPISRAEIARRLGVSPSTVRRDLCREPPPTSRARRDLAAQARVQQRQQRASQVGALREQGLSQSAIARHFGVSRWTVRDDLSDRPKRPWRRPELEERDRRARELYASGVKVPDIAVEFGVSAGTIWKDLRPGLSRVGPRRGAEVRRLVARGDSKLKIAERLKVNPCVVYAVPDARRISLPQRFGPQAKALHAQGLSISAIEHELKLSRTTVSRALATDVTVVHHRRPGKRCLERQRALKVLKLFEAGTPKAEIARRLRMGLHTIYRVIRLDAAGMPVAIRPKRKPDAKRVRKLSKQGLGKSAIARRLGISRTTVRALLGAERPPVPPDRAERVRDLFASGLSKNAIAGELKMSLSDVYRVLPAQVRPSESVAARRTPPRRQPRAMTIQQFAQEQGVEVGRVREAIAAGMIRSIAIGKTVLISHDEYVRLLREAHHGLSVQS